MSRSAQNSQPKDRRTIRFVLILLVSAAYGVLTAQKNGMPLSVFSSTVFAATIAGWITVSQFLLRFIDSRNRSRKSQGLAGVFALLVAILVIEWFVFRLKREAGLALDASASFSQDFAWLLVSPVLTYHFATKKSSTPTSPPSSTPGGVSASP